MTIEKIACPRLNGVSICDSCSKSEVFVKFNDKEQPMAIMCDHYILRGDGLYVDKEYVCDINKKSCVHKEWKFL